MLSGDLLAGRVTKKYIKNLTTQQITNTISKSWYHLDHLNSTKCVTNATGSREVLYEYRAFGEELKKLGSGKAKYTYGGKELDSSTNLYYFNARYYDATIGRFINVDPIQDGVNWYVYCGNNPLSFKDPTGLMSDISKALLVAGITITAVGVVAAVVALTAPASIPAIAVGLGAAANTAVAAQLFAGTIATTVAVANGIGLAATAVGVPLTIASTAVTLKEDKENDKLINDKNKQINDLKTKRNDLEQKNNKSEKKINSLEDENKKLKKELENLRNDKKSNTAENNEKIQKNTKKNNKNEG